MRSRLLLFLLVAAAIPLQAATIRVPQDQSSIQSAIALSLDGDSILVSSGVYSENLTLLGKSLVLISSAGADSTFLQSTETGTALLTANGNIDSSASVQGFTFSNSSATHIVELRDGSRLNLSRNRFTQLVGYETIVFCYNSDPLIERNVFAGNSVGHACVGVYTNNSKARIINNTFYENTRGFYCLSGLAIAKNNIVANSGAYGIHGLFAELAYNDVWNNTVNYDGGASQGPGDISANPLFVDADTFIFRLAAGSPCINAGDPNPIYNDPDGSRNDMGALRSRGGALYVPQDFETIQAAIDALYEEDTIRVSPGTYNENLDAKSKEFHLVGTAGPDSTIIVAADSGQPIFHFDWDDYPQSAFDGDTVLIQGITFRGANLASAVDIAPVHTHMFRNCVFDSNTSSPFSRILSMGVAPEFIMKNCQFTRNVGNLVIAGGNTLVDSCIIAQNQSDTLFSLSSYEFTRVERCSFYDNVGVVLSIRGGESVYIRGNRFSHNTGKTLYSGNTDGWYREFTSNILDSNIVDDLLDLYLEVHGEWVSIDSNLIVNNYVSASMNLESGEGINFSWNTVQGNYFGDTLGIFGKSVDCISYYATNNVITNNLNTVGLSLNDGSHPACNFVVQNNDSWSNERGNFGGDVESSLNISADPFFCDPEFGDFTLAAQSPAVGMGPFGIGCDAAPNLEFLSIENQQVLHLTTSQPKVIWHSTDMLGDPQTSFEIAVSTDNDWQFAEMWNPAPFASADTSVVYNGAPLIDGQTYYLRLRVSNSLGYSNWSELTFRMNSLPTTPTLVSPTGGTTVNSTEPSLVINNSSDAENDSLYYTFEIASDSSMTTPHAFMKKQDPAATTAATVDIVLVENTEYFWRVKASDYYEESAHSIARSFWVNASNSAPNQFNLMAPENSFSPPLATETPTLQWTPAIDSDPFDAVSYALHLALDSNFSFAHIIPAIASTQFVIVDPLTSGTRYWWKVKAIDLNGGETWSSQTFQFRTMKVGDNDANGIINITDIVYIINYIFAGGPLPIPPQAGDANCDDRFNITDAVYLINYIFADGPPPCEAGR